MRGKLKKGYLQWRCRRGTKELDVVLNRFLDLYYTELTDTDLLDFDRLLNTEDTILWYWLSGKESPEDKDTKELVEKITEAKKRHV